MESQKSMGQIALVATSITSLAVVILVAMMVVTQISETTGTKYSESVTNETQHIDYEVSTAFDNSGDEYECTLGNVFFDDRDDVLLTSEFYTDLSPNCEIQATETYDLFYNDCLQQLATANDTLGDGDCYASDDGLYECEPPASDNCEQADNESWYDLDWDTSFDMYPNGSAGWGYVTTYWDYPNADTINESVLEIKFDPVELDDPITEQYTIPDECMLETGVQTYVLVNQSGTEDWKIQCANNESGFTTLANGTYDVFYLFEQEMWWDVTNEENNPYVDSDWLINYDYEYVVGSTTTINDSLDQIVSWIPLAIVIVLGMLAWSYFGIKKKY